MLTVDVRELKQQANELIRLVRGPRFPLSPHAPAFLGVHPLLLRRNRIRIK
jgi:hypothetical protein